MKVAIVRVLRLWFTFEERVTRRAYVLSGVALALLKYAVDVALVWGATGRLWLPLDYLSPLSALYRERLAVAPADVLPLLALWSLPFLWVGISMTMRRALDAGYSAWLALFFFVPGLNYAVIGLLALLPSGPHPSPEPDRPRPHEAQLPSALLAIAVGATFGVGMLALSVYGLRRYGAALFLGTPFVIGALTAFLFNRRYAASGRETQQVVVMTMACVGGVAILTAAEGAICLLMAAPLALAIGAMGASLGRRIALRDRAPAANALMALLALPLSATLEGPSPGVPLREVRSAVVIDAPPMAVWEQVIAFPPLPAPRELLFRSGIAYPMRAEMTGEGVGAVRRCVFSTGAFVEPVTRWEPGRRLSFDVDSQPPPMQEWSPYADMSPPHLDGWIQSRRGEFRLVELPGGRTRLEGSTWYEMHLQPGGYWALYGDWIIGRIHGRVLDHVKAQAEGGGA